MPDKITTVFQVNARAVYGLPYFTRNGGDTEYLLSNPNGVGATATLTVFDRECKATKPIELKFAPHCTQSVRLRGIVPDNAGHAILAADTRLVAHLLYTTGAGVTVAGGELGGNDNLAVARIGSSTRTYSFGYRALALGKEKLSGAVFVSNPHAVDLNGVVVFYDQSCAAGTPVTFRIKAGCTREFPFPDAKFGYGLVGIEDQAIINVIHFTSEPRHIAATELVGERNLVDVPAIPPATRKAVVFDDTHLGGMQRGWTTFDPALAAAGLSVTHITAPPLTAAALQNAEAVVIGMSPDAYSQAEIALLVAFVQGGGGLFLVTDFGGGVWSAPMRAVLNAFGITDENNTASDPTNSWDGDPGHILFDNQRNFRAHPIVSGVSSLATNATPTLAASSGAPWDTVIETDADTLPARRPILMARSFGAGRVVAFGDASAIRDTLLGTRDNKTLAVRCVQWVLFRI